MGLAYEAVRVRFPPAQRQSDYLLVNPLGTLPTLIDGETTVFESVGAIDYLARRYGPTPLAPEPGAPGFGAYLQCLHLSEAGLSGPLTFLLHARFLGPPDAAAEWTQGDILQTFAQRLGLVKDRLALAPYLAGEAFTAADIAVGYALLMARWMSVDEAFDGPINDYLERITGRPAFECAIAV